MKPHIESLSDNEFIGWLVDNQGNEILTSRVTDSNKIAVGSKLGKIKKGLEAITTSRSTREVPSVTKEDTEPLMEILEEYIGQSEKKPRQKKDANVLFYTSVDSIELKQDRSKFVEAIVKRAKEVREINGVICHIVEGNWGSNFKFTHGAIHYSFEVIAHGDAFEVVISDGYQISLGATYFDQHIPKFCDWFKSLTELVSIGDTIHGARNKYSNHMLIWLGNSYKIFATKPI